MKHARALSLARPLGVAAALMFAAFAGDRLQAQAPPPAAPAGLDVQALEKAQQAFNAARYDEAAGIYESVPKDYPTSPLIPEANFRLGYTYFLTGKYDEAIAALNNNLTGKNIPPEVMELSQSLKPQVLSAKASKMEPENPGRKAAFEDAIKEFATFIQKFPQSEELENAYYGKARAHLQVEQFELGAEALKVNLQKFPQSPSALDTQLLLALVLGSQASTAMQKATAKDPTADAAYDQALKLLGDIIGKRSDIALANDAQFQLGEILFARASFQKDKEQQQTMERALAAYRAVLPKELVLKAQQDRVTQIGQLIQQAKQNRDLPGIRRAERFQQREQEKLATFQERPDQTLLAKMKSGQIFMTLQIGNSDARRFDEARLVFRFVEQFTEDPEQKKQLLYFITVTYAAQNLAAKAVEHYEKLMAAHKADPVGENLALLIGMAYLDPANNDPDKAIKYFEEQAANYPESKFTGQAVMQQALAMIPLKRYDEALDTLKKFIASKPSQELAAVAESGLATIYKDTGKPAEAIKSFKTVRETYPGTPQAEQASFWVPQMMFGSGDAKGAVDEFKAFISKFPDSELAPPAMLLLGDAQAAAGLKDAALKSYGEVAAKHPKSEAASHSFFNRAKLHQNDGKLPETLKAMREFIATYPESEQLYRAYDYIQQIQTAEKQPLEAIATLEEYVSKRPQDASAATALLKISGHWKKYGEEQGPFLALDEAKRAEWVKGIDNSTAAAEKIIDQFPESPEVALALQNLLANQKLQVKAKLKTEADIEQYFTALAKKYEGKVTTKSKIVFALAGFLSEKDMPKAVETMSTAYDPSVIYAPADLDLYGTALIEQKNYDEAQKVFDKLAKDYPVPPGLDMSKAPKAVWEPQSIALYGTARILQEKGKTKEAQAKFEELKNTYPYSLKLLEADFGIAAGLAGQKKHDEALKLLAGVTKRNDAPVQLRAKAMLLLGKVLQASGNHEDAAVNFLKISKFFEGVPEIAAEGLWLGAQIREKQSTGEIPMMVDAAPGKKAPAKAPAGAKK